MKNLTFNNLIKRAAALMIAGIVTCATFMGNGMNVKAAGYDYGWDRATDTYHTTVKTSGAYVYQNANRIGHTIYNQMIALNAHPLVGLAKWGDMDCDHVLCIDCGETYYLSNIAASYGAPAAELYLKCAQVGCFTDYYDYVGNSEWSFQDPKVKGTMIAASFIQTEEQFIHAIAGPWGTLAQAESILTASGMTYNQYAFGLDMKTVTPQYTAHATTVGTSGTAATVKGAATTTTGFDATFYASMYPDVVKVVGSSQKALYTHYVKYGKAEGRYQNLAEYQAAQQKK